MPPVLERPSEGAVVTTLTTGLVAVGLLTGAGALLSGLAGWRAALLAVLIPLALSAAIAAVVGLFLATALTSGPAPPPPGRRAQAERAQAEAEVRAQESRLLRAVQTGEGDEELQQVAVALHRARLALATVVLAEEGCLPQGLKDELAVADRGMSAWHRSEPT